MSLVPSCIADVVERAKREKYAVNGSLFSNFAFAHEIEMAAAEVVTFGGGMHRARPIEVAALCASWIDRLYPGENVWDLIVEQWDELYNTEIGHDYSLSDEAFYFSVLFWLGDGARYAPHDDPDIAFMIARIGAVGLEWQRAHDVRDEDGGDMT